jgi:hypothetical protein
MMSHSCNAWWLLFLCLQLASAAPKQSVRQRLAAASGSKSTSPVKATTATSSTTSSRSVRQRLAASTKVCKESVPDHLPLTNSLRHDWAKGEISAKKVQEYAWGAEQQGAVGLKNLASAGTWGTNPQKVQRTLLRLFGQPAGAPEIDWFRIPTKTGFALHPFLLPHKFFSSMFTNRYEDWIQYLQGPPGSALQYWEKIRDSPYMTKHPNFPRSSWQFTMPIGFHGDAGSFSNEDSLLVLSWNSLLGKGCTRRKRFVFTFLRKSEYTQATLDLVFRIFAWSTNQMASGSTSCTDYMGNPIHGGGQQLAGGAMAMLCQVRGDWAFYVGIFRFVTWSAADRICWMC